MELSIKYSAGTITSCFGELRIRMVCLCICDHPSHIKHFFCRSPRDTTAPSVHTDYDEKISLISKNKNKNFLRYFTIFLGSFGSVTFRGIFVMFIRHFTNSEKVQIKQKEKNHSSRTPAFPALLSVNWIYFFFVKVRLSVNGIFAFCVICVSVALIKVISNRSFINGLYDVKKLRGFIRIIVGITPCCVTSNFHRYHH